MILLAEGAHTGLAVCFPVHRCATRIPPSLGKTAPCRHNQLIIGSAVRKRPDKSGNPDSNLLSPRPSVECLSDQKPAPIMPGASTPG